MQISDTPRAGFEPAQNLSSSLVEQSCAVAIITTPDALGNARVIFEFLKRCWTGSQKLFKWFMTCVEQLHVSRIFNNGNAKMPM